MNLPFHLEVEEFMKNKGFILIESCLLFMITCVIVSIVSTEFMIYKKRIMQEEKDVYETLFDEF